MRRLAVLTAGVALASFLAFHSPKGAVMVSALSALAALALTARRTGPEKTAKIARLAAAGLMFGTLLSCTYTVFVYRPAEALAGQTIRLEAQVTGVPRAGLYGVTLPVRGNEAGARPFAISLRLPEEYGSLRPGDRIACVVHCSASQRGSGPLAQHARARGVFLEGKAYGAISVSPAQGFSLRYAPALAAQRLSELLLRLYPPESAAFLKALIIGNKEDLSPADQNAFARTGLSHVVSVSGMHVSFLAGMLYLALGRERRGSAALQIAIIFFFAAMAGGSPGALRAAVFWTMGLLAPFFGRRSDPITSLSAALLVLLILRPYSIADVSLQLSFAATLGIFLIALPLRARMMARLDQKQRRRFGWLIALAAVSLGANLLTIPLSALYFGQISILAPLINILSNWAVVLSFFGGVLSLAAALFFFPLAALLARLTELPLACFLAMARRGSELPFAALPTDSVYYQLFFAFLYALLLLCLFYWRRGERRLILPAASLTAALCLSLFLSNASLKFHTLDLTLLDVQQGQSIALISDGYRALIDCGGSRYAAGIAAAHFYGLGYHGIDLLVVTHYDADHVDGVAELLKRMRVSALALPDVAPENPFRREMEALALAAGTALWYIDAETQVEFGHTRLTLYPPLGGRESNEEGLSILCTAGAWAALVTGDMNAETEEILLANYALPELALFVAGHHGSKHSTSEQLLDALSPAVVFISAGAGNSYGHPAEETLLRLDEREIPLYRSDRMGSITLTLQAPR